MNSSRTNLLDKWCDKMIEVSQRRSVKILSKQFDDAFEIEDITVEVYPHLTDNEKEECRRLLIECYANFIKRLHGQRNWVLIFAVLQDLQLRHQSNDGPVLKTVNIEIKHFIVAIVSSIHFESILTGSEDWCLDDLIALNDEQIIERLKRIIQGKTTFEKIKYLSNFRSKLREYEEKHGSLNCFLFDKLHLTNRNSKQVFDEIDKLFLLATPALELKSKEQIKILRRTIFRVSELIEGSHRFVEIEGEVIEFKYRLENRLDFMIDNNKVIVKNQAADEKDPGFEIPKEAKPSDLIRALLSKIAYLNKRYESENLDLKLWLYYLLMNEGSFSLNHILAAANRSSVKEKHRKRILSKQS